MNQETSWRRLGIPVLQGGVDVKTLKDLGGYATWDDINDALAVKGYSICSVYRAGKTEAIICNEKGGYNLA